MSGLAGVQNAMVIPFIQDGTGATNNNYTITRMGLVMDAWNVSKNNQVGGTVQIFRQALGSGSYNAVTDAMNAGVDTALTHAGTLLTSQAVFSATDVLRFATVGAATLCNAAVLFVPFPFSDLTTIP